MAIDINSFPVVAYSPFHIGYFNFLKESINRRATQVSVAVTLPDTLVAGDSVYTKFGPWLKKARVAIETLITANKYGHIWRNDPYSALNYWTAWTKAGLLDYIKIRNWVYNASSQAGDWMAYDTFMGTPIDTPCYIGYVNEIFYALELLCFFRCTTTASADTYESKTKSVMGEASATAAWDAANTGYNALAWTTGIVGGAPSAAVTASCSDAGGGTYNALFNGYRSDNWHYIFPVLSYDADMLLMRWHDTNQYYTDPYAPNYYRARMWNAVDYGGNRIDWFGDASSMFGTLDSDGYRIRTGGSWNNEGIDFSHKWGYTVGDTWAGYTYGLKGSTFSKQAISTPQSGGGAILRSSFDGYLANLWQPQTNDFWLLQGGSGE